MIQIRFDDDLNMYVLIVGGEMMMKNKKQSVLLKKYGLYLQGQGL